MRSTSHRGVCDSARPLGRCLTAGDGATAARDDARAADDAAPSFSLSKRRRRRRFTRSTSDGALRGARRWWRRGRRPEQRETRAPSPRRRRVLRSICLPHLSRAPRRRNGLPRREARRFRRWFRASRHSHRARGRRDPGSGLTARGEGERERERGATRQERANERPILHPGGGGRESWEEEAAAEPSRTEPHRTPTRPAAGAPSSSPHPRPSLACSTPVGVLLPNEEDEEARARSK